MTDTKKLGKRAGISLVLMFAMGLPSITLREVSSSILSTPDLLEYILTSSSSTRLAIMLSFFSVVAGLIFSSYAYQVLKSCSSFSAILFLGLWILQTGMIIVGDVCCWVMLETAQFVQETGNNSGSFTLTVAQWVKGYYGAHFLSLIAFVGALAFLHANMLRYRLLPSWLSIWALIATSLVFIATWLQIFNQEVSEHFYNQNGIFMIIFSVYLAIRGFRGGE